MAGVILAMDKLAVREGLVVVAAALFITVALIVQAMPTLVEVVDKV